MKLILSKVLLSRWTNPILLTFSIEYLINLLKSAMLVFPWKFRSYHLFPHVLLNHLMSLLRSLHSLMCSIRLQWESDWTTWTPLRLHLDWLGLVHQPTSSKWVSLSPSPTSLESQSSLSIHLDSTWTPMGVHLEYTGSTLDWTRIVLAHSHWSLSRV